jgi:hypothetical protein
VLGICEDSTEYNPKQLFVYVRICKTGLRSRLRICLECDVHGFRGSAPARLPLGPAGAWLPRPHLKVYGVGQVQ